MRAVLDIILILLQLYWWVLLIMIIMSWLISFNVINTRNQFVATVWQVLNQLTDPVLKPIRRFMPNFSGLDLSPLAALVLLQLVITWLLFLMVAGAAMPPGTLVWYALLRIIVGTIRLYFFAILVHVVLSWVSPGHWNPLISVLNSLVAPVLRPVRRVIPPIGGLDLSPLFVLIGLQALLIMIRLPGHLA